jgi:hypothetical protein
MSSLLPNLYTLDCPRASSGGYKMYTMYRNGLYKTRYLGEARELLKDGWYDKTHYQPNEEVLSYGNTKYGQETNPIIAWRPRQTSENACSTGKQHEEKSGRCDTSSERDKPRHEQYHPNVCNDAGKEHLLQTVRSGSQRSEVKRKRGRPKQVK